MTAGEAGALSVWSAGSGAGGGGAAHNGANKKLTASMKKLHVKRHKPY